MRYPTKAQIKREINESQTAAEKLTSVGMSVIVTDDLGNDHPSKTTSMPWALGHGQMVVNCEGFRCYMTNRVRPSDF